MRNLLIPWTLQDELALMWIEFENIIAKLLFCNYNAIENIAIVAAISAT